ncbi:MAG: serine hydrolase [Planctomycetota bacterium]|nr:serine hydrolase [Planctomycetota bacterium]
MSPTRALLSFVLLPAALHAQSGVPRADLRALADRAFELFEPVGMAVAVVEDGEVAFADGFGERFSGGGEPVLPTTVFQIASCTKAFTAAAVGRLVADGALAWDDRVIDHLPWFRLSDPWITRELTVRDLLCHRSGLATFAGDLLWYGSSYDEDEVFRRAAKLPITKRFRSEFGYQNILYAVAGRVVEKVSGQEFGAFLEQRFFEPLGMDDTAFGFDRLGDGQAPALPHIEGQGIDIVRFGACKPAGAIWSTAQDMAAWVRALLDGGRAGDADVIPAQVLHAAWTPHTPMPAGRRPDAIEDFRSYGLGWFLTVEHGKKVVEHDGGMPGYLSKVTLVPEDRFGMVVLHNTDTPLLTTALRAAVLAARNGGDGEAVLQRYAEAASDRRARAADEVRAREAERVEGTEPSLALAGYAGLYRDEILGDARVELRDDELHLRILPSGQTFHGALAHWHHDVFRVDFPDRFLPFALVAFRIGSDGVVEGFGIDCPIPDFDFDALSFRRVGD